MIYVHVEKSVPSRQQLSFKIMWFIRPSSMTHPMWCKICIVSSNSAPTLVLMFGIDKGQMIQEYRLNTKLSYSDTDRIQSDHRLTEGIREMTMQRINFGQKFDVHLWAKSILHDRQVNVSFKELNIAATRRVTLFASLWYHQPPNVIIIFSALLSADVVIHKINVSGVNTKIDDHHRLTYK